MGNWQASRDALMVAMLALAIVLMLIPAPAAADFSMATGHGNVTMPLTRQFQYIYTPDGKKTMVIMDGYSLTQTPAPVNLDNVEQEIQDTLNHIRGRGSDRR